MNPVPDLPVRNITDVIVADLLSEPGCPVCSQAGRTARRFIDSMLWESVNDVGFRRQLDAARGFCRRHTLEVVAAERNQSGGTLGSAILLDAVLAVRGREANAIHAAKGRSRGRRVAEARRPPACPVCAHAASAEADVIGSILRLSDDPGWREALSAAPFCLDHLVVLMARARPAASWQAIERHQLERVRRLQELVQAYADNSGHDRRHLMTDEERRATDAVARLLGGSG